LEKFINQRTFCITD